MKLQLLQKLILSGIFVLYAMAAMAQDATQTVKGKVTNANTGEPLDSVLVRFEGVKKGVLTSADGTFQIVKKGDTNVLVFSLDSFDEKRLEITDFNQEVNISLSSDIRFNQYGQIVERKELTSEARNGFITWESKDKKYRLWMDNRIYLDGAHYFDNYDYNKTPDENALEGRVDVPDQLLKLRRMRFAIKAIVGDGWYGEIDFDFDGNEVDIKDAYIRKILGNWGQIRVGQFRMPQGMEQNTTSRYLKFIERASVAEFNPNRRLGIGYSMWGKSYELGIALHTEQVRHVLDFTNNDPDPNYFKGEIPGAKPMLGVSTRGAYYFVNETGRLLMLGAGYSGRTPGLYKYPDNRIKYDPKDETNVSELEWTVAKVNDVKWANNFNVEAAATYGPLRVSGEYYYNVLKRNEQLDPVKYGGFYVETAFLLTGESHAWNYKEAEFTQIRSKGKAGALEATARYSYINLNDYDTNQTFGAKDQYTVGLNYYATGNIKFMLNYSYVNHDRYSNGAGDYAQYIDIYAPAGEGGFDYGFIAWRCEIDF